MQGIAWGWQRLDGALTNAPLAQEAVGPNPTDRGKQWEHAPSVGGRAWHPFVVRREPVTELVEVLAAARDPGGSRPALPRSGEWRSPRPQR